MIGSTAAIWALEPMPTIATGLLFRPWLTPVTASAGSEPTSSTSTTSWRPRTPPFALMRAAASFTAFWIGADDAEFGPLRPIPASRTIGFPLLGFAAAPVAASRTTQRTDIETRTNQRALIDSLPFTTLTDEPGAL